MSEADEPSDAGPGAPEPEPDTAAEAPEESTPLPPPVAPPPPPSQPAPSLVYAGPTGGGDGPIGKPRGVLFVILISIVTLGIYHLYWTYKSFEEMKRHTGEGIGGVLGLVIAIVVNPVIWFLMPSEVGKMYRRSGRRQPLTGWSGLWILLPLVGWIVWTVRVQGGLNRYWEGVTAAR